MRTMVWVIWTVPASRSTWFQRTARASPIRTPVASMKVTRSGRSCTACPSAVRLFCRRVTSLAVSARGGVLGLGLDGVDLTDGVDRGGAVADGECHRTGDDGAAGSGGGGAGVVLDVGEHGVEALGGGFADAEFAEGGADVVLDGASVGVEGGG